MLRMSGEIGKCTDGFIIEASIRGFNGPKMSLPPKNSVVERGFDRNMVESLHSHSTPYEVPHDF